MSLECKSAVTEGKGSGNLPFREGLCLPFLLRAQNSDGGWGYHPKSKSSVEPTAWATLALREEAGRYSEQLDRAAKWLHQAQLADGAWPAAAGDHPGGWVTALACLALVEHTKAPGEVVIKGHRWLIDSWPAEGNWLWRLRQRWYSKSGAIVRQDHALHGWSWTPGTASWVEPTAYVLILLRNIPAQLYSAGTAKRRQLGERMLHDRVCPDGGWNVGNPMIYGVPGEPRVGPTAWALLALKDYKERPEIKASLDWLERNYENISGPGSLAVAHLCFSAYGRPIAPAERRLIDFYEKNHFLRNVVVAAWVCLALGSVPAWLEGSSKAGDKA